MKIKLKTTDIIYEYTGKEYISIDRDIADTIRVLWGNDIITYESGGGETPWVQIHEKYTDTDIIFIKSLLEDSGKPWIVYQWCISAV